MPELPEVETVRRTLASVLEGRKIVSAEFPPDSIVQSGLPEGTLLAACDGAQVEHVGRHGKYWWLELDRQPWIFGHLGMAGWIREIGQDSIRLREHGNAPFEDQQGRTRFLKMMLETDEGRRIVMTDGRRLARLWLAADAEQALSRVGPDMYNEPWSVDALAKKLKARNAPIKGLLLDQTLFCGIGNWIADEVLYQAGIAPRRSAGSLLENELEQLIAAIKAVLDHAVEVGANAEKYPESWLFHHRWGGAKGSDLIGGAEIRREPVGGRTTAWVPSRQK